MGCIQSYFRKAASGSSQASPTDIVKHIIEHDRSKRTNNSAESSRVPIASHECTSTVNDETEDLDSDMAECGSLHCVEATAVRTLAASTGTVAILGTTAKYNENVDYRRSIHSEQAYILDLRDENPVSEKEDREPSEKQLKSEVDVATPSDAVDSTNIVTTAIIEVPPTTRSTPEEIKIEETPNQITYMPAKVCPQENHLPKVIDSIEKQPVKVIPMKTEATTNHPPPPYESETSEDKTNENSSSSEVVSIIKEAKEIDLVKHNRTSFELSRPNRLSLGQQSIESDQNTIEISSADDVKNESTDITSPESLRESFDESLIVSMSSKKSNAKEISNTSLNTLGNDSADEGSDFEADICRKEGVMKRFDTISSNGESSYRMEEPDYSSVTEESDLKDFTARPSYTLEITSEEVFDGDHHQHMENIRKAAIHEVNIICEQAIDKMTDILMCKANAEDVNNVSESSLLSAVDSMMAEKGSDYDSLSFLDEPSDSRSVSIFGDDTKSCRSETIYEVPTGILSPQYETQKRAETSPMSSAMVISVSLQDDSGAVIVHEDRSLTEDLPKPPNLEDLPPLPENLDQYDISEEELKAVQLPEHARPTYENVPILVEPTVEAAASKIQAGVRGYLTRKQIKGLKNEKTGGSEADTFDTESLRNYAKNKRLSLDSKLVDFEKIRKLPKLKSTLSECVEEEGEAVDLNKAAAKIQSSYRDHRARKSICLGDRNPTAFNQRTIMALKSAKQKDNRDEKDECHEMHTKFKLEESDKELPQPTEANKDKPDPVEEAAVKIQATYRGFRTRRSIQMSASAATKIQAHFRGYKVRKSMKRCSSLNDLGVTNSNSSSCSNISSQHTDLEKHVTKIQAGVRGYLVRKRHSLQNTAAAKIQLNYRKYKSRKMSLVNKPAD